MNMTFDASAPNLKINEYTTVAHNSTNKLDGSFLDATGP